MDQVNYLIVPTVDQGYTPGTCSFHLQEDESWSGVDGPGTERTWYYQIEKATMKDGTGTVIGTVGFADNGQDSAPVTAGDGNPLVWKSSLPDGLSITPEAQGDPRDYIQFSIGGQNWKTSTGTGTAYCQTGDWDSSYSPAVSFPSSFVLEI